MKTPREILLQRHPSVGAKLDGIRDAVVTGLKQQAVVPSRNLPLTAVLKLWGELILPCRSTWASLAAAWIAILLLNLAQADSGQKGVATSTMQMAELRFLLQEKHRVLAELVGTAQTTAPAATPPRTELLPRSDTRSDTSAA